MFAFWTKDSRGSEKTVDATLPMPLFAKPVQAYLDSTAAPKAFRSPEKLKRKISSVDISPLAFPNKRTKIESRDITPPADDVGAPCEAPEPAVAGIPAVAGGVTDQPSPDTRQVQGVIQFQLSLEILNKHNELRLIDQELAKCQIALEQLRRCHLIPYPVTCPTPEQMLDISSGKGPAMRKRPGEPVPEWAAPYGVVDGPYARHYAKWLIPDPKFDGLLPAWQGLGGQASAPVSATEGRTTRNSVGESVAPGNSRGARASAGSKLHSLNTGYAQPKQKAPCVLKRSDGKTVKLVCVDCHRENFSSTQGFINHCRIAHKRDYKSHEEAAVHCGHPIEVDEVAGSGVTGGLAATGSSAGPSAASATEDRVVGAGPSPAVPASGLVHTFARTDMSEQEAFASLETRLDAALKSYTERKLPLPVPQASSTKTEHRSTGSSSVSAPEAPHLSRLLMRKELSIDLGLHVADAKTKEDISDMYMADDDEDSEEGEEAAKTQFGPAVSRTPGVMRMPARAPAASASAPCANGAKGCSTHMTLDTPIATPTTEVSQPAVLFDDDMDVELSPNTLVSNNAPSLVSDDSEYDDSDDGSSSDVSDSMDQDSVTEIKLEDEHDLAARVIGKGSSAVNLKKEEARHVTFVSPVRGAGKEGRRRKNSSRQQSRVQGDARDVLP
ncbi:hypothetical protein MGG_01008 [Pyricularia oryzae 70-15]|uniref:AHC1-like C2H2 zinc-finger domain-containing protein n=3 Tax=Pyricularia oryzae TaxID=318829 RepID=G4NCV9_PYRO7|nr:uncharacterized protein MGG_01008 [Pyricularia oryzae 70-15]EHA48352.1 hypothetical protein MGG_01008 [Pyricularia oryzae 70-15]ELQ40104.1 hypothetical protein OOU_Y34scaffold00462g58 [Pyricularia oryzae Y34]